MKVVGILQAVIILLLLAAAASCEVGKEYSQRVFSSAKLKKQDSTSLKFMPISGVDSSSLITVQSEEKVKSDSTDTTEITETTTPREMNSGTKRTKRVRQE